MEEKNEKGFAIAVVGVGAIFPGAKNASEFWKVIVEGTDQIGEVPSTHWSVEDFYDKDTKNNDKTYCKRGAFVPNIEFDPLEWGIPPQVIPVTDTSQLLALIAAKEVLKDTYQGDFLGVDLSRASVILGVTCGQELITTAMARVERPVWEKVMRQSGIPEAQVKEMCDKIAAHYTPWQENTFPGLLGNVVAGRIANRLNFGGTNCTTDAACASSLSALSVGINELRLHQSDLVIVGGADAFNNPFAYVCFSKTPALSPTEDCRPFSAKSDGTLLGEGVGLFALKRLDDAEKQGNQIYAVIRGVGTSSDGKAKSIYAPVAKGQVKAIERAYESAGYSPTTVTLVEAHGTGTRAGDNEEFQGIKEVFEKADKERKQWCALGTIKSQIGHTKGAAGAAGLFKIVMALHHKVLPPTIKIEAPNPSMEIDNSPFYLNTIAQPWVMNAEHPRRAALSSFGFGGTNFHLTVEEYQGTGKKPLRLDTRSEYLVLLSSNDAASLKNRSQELILEAEKIGDLFIPHFSHQSLKTFQKTDSLRLGIIARDEKDFIEKLKKAIEHLEKAPQLALDEKEIIFSNGSVPGKTAFVFTGEGSQYLGMGGDLALSLESATAIWDQTVKIPLDPSQLMHEIVFPKPAFTDEEKKHQQALLDNTMWAQPALAAVAFSQLAVLDELGFTPDVVAGHRVGELIALAYAGGFDFPTLVKLAKKRGELTEQASAEQFRTFLDIPFNTLKRSVFSHATASGYPQEEDKIKDLISEQLEKPIRFVEMIEAMYASGVRTFVEIGPDNTLSKLINRILQGKEFKVVSLDQRGTNGLVAFWKALADLSVRGISLNFEKLLAHYALPSVPESKEKRKYRILINGANVKPVQVRAASETVKLVNPVNSAPVYAVSNASSTDGTIKEAAPGKAREPEKNGFPFPVEQTKNSSPNQQPEQVPQATMLKASFAPQTAPTSKPAPQSAELTSTILTIIATETGYPVEMLNMEMEMEADLGIDSIKRVEILAAIQAKFPDFPELDPGQLSSLKTLQQLCGFIQNQPVTSAPKATTSPTTPLITPSITPIAAPMYAEPSAPKLTPQPSTPQLQSPEITSAVLSIIAAETGYPVEMLNMGMEMEADLGIDSIKRVEILAAIQAKFPDFPELDPGQLSTLKTLQQLCGFIQKQPASSAPITTSPPTAPPITSAIPPTMAPISAEAPAPKSTPQPLTSQPQSKEITSAVLSIIAAETGYPVEMLNMGMEMEADLGIDSIKRVEILAAIQSKFPDFPELDPGQLSTLKTLQQLCGFIQHQPVTSAPIAITSPAAPPIPSPITPIMAPISTEQPAPKLTPQLSTPQPQSTEITSAVLSIIAAETGYPVEMLNMEMEMEADLGIDSIKRVEILAAIQAKFPDFPELDPGQLSTLKTLQQLSDFIQKPNPKQESVLPVDTVSQVSSKDNEKPFKINESLKHYRRVLKTRSVPLKGELTPGLKEGVTTVIKDKKGISTYLVEKLRKNGINAQEVNQVLEDNNCVIYLGGLEDFKQRSEAININLEAFEVVKTLSKKLSNGRGTFILVQNTGGDFGLSNENEIQAWSGGLVALTRTAALEWPTAYVKGIDLDCTSLSPEEIAERLVQELLLGGAEKEVGLGKSSRIILELSQETY